MQKTAPPIFIDLGDILSIRLSPRLQRIADYIPAGSRVIDVGTDHAYIPIWLLQTGRADHAVAADIRSGPLGRAAADAEKYEVSDRLQLLLTNGLSGVAPDSVDTVIIAGMGGETILGILEASPWALEKRLILQPQTKPELLRAWLGERGCRVSDASLVYDTGRIYLVWLIARGEMRPAPAVDPVLVEKRDPLLRPFAEDQIKRLRKQIQGMERSASSDRSLLAGLKEMLNAYLELYEEVVLWQA